MSLLCLLQDDLTMRQTVTTPLSLTLAHWTEVKTRAHDLSVVVKKGRWQTLCTAEWPTYQVGWPPEGSFSLEKIRQVRGRHPDSPVMERKDQATWGILPGFKCLF